MLLIQLLEDKRCCKKESIFSPYTYDHLPFFIHSSVKDTVTYNSAI